MRLDDVDLDAYYRVDGWGNVAFRLLGHSPAHGFFEAKMVGDDRMFLVDAEELTKLEDDEFCVGCGQIGCHADVQVKADRLVIERVPNSDAEALRRGRTGEELFWRLGEAWRPVVHKSKRAVGEW